MLIRFHYNRQASAKGLPWTLHTSKACHKASHVRFLVPTETEEKPDKRRNPRYFMVCRGIIKFEGAVATVVPEER